MPLRAAVLELVVADMAATLAFYRRLGLDLPADADGEPHVEAGIGGHLPPWDAFWGQRYAVVHDPDGTPVDLFAGLPA